MSINLETLIRQTVPSWTYGTTIAGATLSTILNSAPDDVYASGMLSYGGTLTLDNPNLVLIGDGPSSGSSITGGGGLITKRFSRIDGFATVRGSYNWDFPSDAVAHGSVRNIGNLAGVIRFGDVDGNLLPPPDLSGLTFDNILGGNYNFRGGADGLKFLNLQGVCGTATNNGIIGHSVNGCDVLWDGCHFKGNKFMLSDPRYVDPDYPVLDSSPTIIKCSPMWIRKSIKNQIVRNCILEGASEETTGFDSLRGTCRCIAKVSANSDASLGIITLHQETPTVQGYTWAQFPEPLVGNNAVGLHALITTGPLKGNYYEIVSQTDNTLTLDTSRFPLSGVQINDFLTVNLAYVENMHYDNHIIAWPDILPIGYWDGISWFGSCFGNHAFRNIFDMPGITPDASKYAGVSDQGIIESSYGFDYKINSRNKTYNNVCVNTGYEFETRYYNPSDVLEPVSHSTYGFRDTRPLVLNNTGTVLKFVDQDSVQLSNPLITATITLGFDGQPSSNSFEAVELFTVGQIVGNVATGTKLGGYKISLVSGAASAVITQDVHNGITWSATLTGYTGNLVMAANPSDEVTVIPKVARKLRSPSGGKIRGKGAGKVSGKPQ